MTLEEKVNALLGYPIVELKGNANASGQVAALFAKGYLDRDEKGKKKYRKTGSEGSWARKHYNKMKQRKHRKKKKAEKSGKGD
jgi:hypothetical protein